MARLATSKRTNPQHKTSALADGFSWGECASFFEIMADGTTGTVKKKFIEYWFSESPTFFALGSGDEEEDTEDEDPWEGSGEKRVKANRSRE